MLADAEATDDMDKSPTAAPINKTNLYATEFKISEGEKVRQYRIMRIRTQ